MSFREFAMREPLPLASIHDAVWQFLRGRTDAVLYGAHAVSAFVDDSHVTQHVELLSPRSAELAEELRVYLAERLQIEIRMHTMGVKFHRLEQVGHPKNRHLVDVTDVDRVSEHRVIAGIKVTQPIDLICQLVVRMIGRTGTVMPLTDLADIHRLLLTFPELKAFEGPVGKRLRESGAPDFLMGAWRKIARSKIRGEDERGGF